MNTKKKKRQCIELIKTQQVQKMMTEKVDLKVMPK